MTHVEVATFLVRRGRVFALALALAGAACATQFVSPDPVARPLDIVGTFATGPSGFRLCTYELPTAPDVTVTVSYLGGTADEPSGKAGLAHLAERVSFLGGRQSGKRSVRDRLIRLGSVFRASTTPDTTDFWDSSRPASLSDILEAEADRMRAPLVGVTETEFLAEKKRTQQEIDDWDRSATAHASAVSLNQLFPAHPFGRSPWGSSQSLESVSLADVTDWLRVRYAPANAVLIIHGAVKADEAGQAVAAAFGSLLAAPGGDRVVPTSPATLAPPTPLQKAGPLITERAPVELPILFVTWAIPGVGKGEEFEARWAASFLQGRLAQEFLDDWRVEEVASMIKGIVGGEGVRTGKVADRLRVNATLWGGAGVFTAEIVLKSERDAQYVYDLVRDIVDRPIWPPPLFKRVALHAGAYYSLLSEHVDRLDGRDVARVVRSKGQYHYTNYLAEENERVVTQGLQEYGRRYITSVGARGVLLAPEARLGVLPDRHGDWIEELGFNEDAETPPDDVVRLPHIVVSPDQEFVARNGTRVVVYRRGAAPLINVRLLAGTSQAPAGLAGVGVDQFSGKLRNAPLIGARVVKEFKGEAFVVGQDALSGNLDNVLADTEELLTFHKFLTVRDFDELKNWHLRRLAERRSLASRRASEILQFRLYPGHPYGEILTKANYDAISESAAESWLEEALYPARATLVIAGDVVPGPALEAQVNQRFGGWNTLTSAREVVPWPSPPLPLRRTVDVVDRPSAPQAAIQVGVRISKPSAQFAPSIDALIWHLERSLDRAFSDKLHLYRATNVSVNVQPQGSSMIIQTTVATQDAAWATQTILEACQRQRDAPLSPGAAERARLEIARTFPTFFDSLDKVSLQGVGAVSIFKDALFWDEYQKAIDHVSPESIQAAARQFVTGVESIVLVGDRAVLLPELAANGFRASEENPLQGLGPTSN
jgi:zinc protease